MRGRHKHPITALLSKSPLPFPITIALISIVVYLIFIFIALLTGELGVVSFSYMHLMQVDFSLVLFVGLFFLDRFYKNFEKKIRKMRAIFEISDTGFDTYLENIFRRMSNGRSLLVALPFVLLSAGSILFFISPTLPNPLFPISQFSPLWIYFSILEFSIIMLSLLGVGVWIGIVTILTAAEMGKTVEITIMPISPDRAGGLVLFSEAILNGVYMYSAIIAIVFPFLAYLVHYLQKFNPLLYYIPIAGLGLVIATICIFFIAPQYFIHKVMVREKNEHLQHISEDINKVLREIRNALRTSEETPNLPSQQLMLVSLQLTEFFKQIERMKTWPSDFPVVTKAISALFLVIIAFMLEQIFVFYLHLLGVSP